MNENLKNLHILARNYNKLYKCFELLSSLCMDIKEKVNVSKKKNFEELLKNIIDHKQNI